MKIVLIIKYYKPNAFCGGEEIFTQTLAESLASEGHEVSVICTDKKDAFEQIRGVSVFRLKELFMDEMLSRMNNDILAAFISNCTRVYNTFRKKELYNTIKKIKPDVIHVQNIFGISPFVWKIAYDNNVPVVHTLHDCFLMCTRFLDCPNADLLRNGKDRICMKPTLLCKVYRSLYKRLSKKVDCVTAPSQVTLDIFKNEGYFEGVKSQKIFNAVNFNYQIVEQWYEDKKKKLKGKTIIKFVFLGRLEESKGVGLLLEVFSRVRDDNIELHIAGTGKLEKMVGDFSRTDKRIKYYGFVYDKEKRDLLLECDVLILPSVVYETFGIVVLDAYQHGMPVIGSRVGGVAEIVEHGRTGLLVEPGSREELVNAINFFARKDNIYKMLDNCMDKLKEFPFEKQLKEYVNVYADVASKTL